MQPQPENIASGGQSWPPAQLKQLGQRALASAGRWAERNPEGMARLAHWVFNRLLADTEGHSLLSLMQSFMLNLAPPNWCSLSPGSLAEADRLVCETGICLIWVPDPEVVAKLVEAPNKATRDAALVDYKDEILDSIDARLVEIMHPKLAELRRLAAESAQAARLGVPSPAQALAAAVISAIVNDHYGFSFGLARREFATESPTTAGFWSHRRALIQCSLQHAILKSSDRPVDGGFNRHMSSHGSVPSHYGEAHAIESLLLMTGALRELEESYLIAERGFAISAPLQDHADRHALLWRAPANTERSRIVISVGSDEPERRNGGAE